MIASSTSGVQQLADRWWRFTNNLLVTALIVVVAAAIGRQVIQGWWSVRATANTIDDETPDEQPPALVRGPLVSRVFVGTAEAAAQELTELCRAACHEQRDLSPFGSIEVAALATGKQLGDYDRFEIYQADGDPTLLAVVAKGAKDGRRDVYCWGLALPVDDEDPPQRWNLSITALGQPPAQEQ